MQLLQMGWLGAANYRVVDDEDDTREQFSRIISFEGCIDC